MPPTCFNLRRFAPAFTGAVVLSLTIACWTRDAAARQGQSPPPPTLKAKPDTPAATSEKPAAKQKYAHITAVDWTHDDNTGIGSGHNFRYVEDDTTVTGDYGSYNQNKKQLNAEGHIVIEDPQHHVTANKADVDNSPKKLAILTGNVVLIMKSESQPTDKNSTGPKVASAQGDKGSVSVAPIEVPGKTAPANSDSSDESVGKARKRGGTATCDRLEDYYKKKFAILSGHLVFKQKYISKGKENERTVTADHGEYDGKKEILTLFAPVEMHDTEGEEMHFKGDVHIHTKEGEESLQSDKEADGLIAVPEDEEGTEDQTQTPAQPAQTPPSPTAKPTK